MMSIVQGGCGLPCLSRPFFNYLVDGKYTGVSEYVQSKDLLDMPQLQFIIEKVYSQLHLIRQLSDSLASHMQTIHIVMLSCNLDLRQFL